ncbi:MAG: helix-turn-helix domain-containing protein [archaeon]
MAEDSFLLLNLKEDKAKKLAQVISNETARKILDFLTKKEATESEIAKDLKIPISTVHYNLKHLKSSGLVIVDEFHYSAKGKEVDHYKLANKYIIITPKDTPAIAKALRKFLPITGIVVGLSAAMYFANSIFRATGGMQEKTLMMAPAADAFLAEETARAANSAVEPVVTHSPIFFQQSFALWFLYGALFVIAIYLLWTWLEKKKRS